MDLYFLCLDQIRQLQQRYSENERALEEYKLDYKYEKNMNTKKNKAFKISKKHPKTKFLELIANKYSIVDKFKCLENIYNDCQNRTMNQLDVLAKDLTLLRLNLRYYG